MALTMNKNEKNLDKAIVKALSDICETLKLRYDSFAWLTHFVNYNQYPQSLKIVFVFESNHALKKAKSEGLFKDIFELTESRLKRKSITIKHIDKAVFFDTEENGADFDSIKWGKKYN